MASASPAQLVTSSTGYLMLRLGEFLRERTETLLRQWDLSARDLRVLGFASARAMSQRELAETAGLDRTTMVGVLDRLESIGYARRERDEHDRRRFIVTVTEAGAHILDRAVTELAAAQTDFLAPFTPEEQRLFHTMVERLFRAHDPNCDPAASVTPTERP